MVKIHDNDVREPVLSHAILKNKNAYDVRITRGNTSSYSNRRFCVEKRLTKPRVCGIIVPASEQGSPSSNRTLRGIAQLVEQRSPKPRAEGSNPSAPAKPTVLKMAYFSRF